ncbi:hypothetical protein [Salegentibacter mishustinae]|uniref:Uncharacterized protein n=1 Tax=Salegentibacter mishustinae TaxID=270918 RepID=A0A0Q9Z9R0_9FLAO|nr:hypothetical protein [Salegentibacter mishustinae]KRG29725.1 hypothetical protein APR42_14890 [Salegentibacter mishustinae]PNW21170.1 hypothetical protein APB85_07840 [Salegentibacter mishustinae]PZX60937.1 hypothetical protein LY54_03135 [Salegentibacter mishustinae]GGW99892.1 hypothetical protein GCM10008086_31310 [Salegentibacter mishustinae]
MIYLKIEDNRGFFLKDKNSPEDWTELDKIEKDDLMKLLDYATEEEFDMDEYNEETLGNKAHQIIYKNLYEKFHNFLSNKNRFKDETDNIFKEELEKYQ